MTIKIVVDRAVVVAQLVEQSLSIKGLQFESQSGLNIFHSVSLDLMFVVSENIPLFG